MATKETDKAATKAEKADKVDHVTPGGVGIQGKVVSGKNTKLSAKEQGQLARGEIDEAGEPTGKEAAPKKNAIVGAGRVSKPEETLYVGKFSAEAIASATGEKVSVVAVQAEPTTEEGLFYHFQQYHPSAKRETFKFDMENKIDPTLRTHLE